MEQTKNSPSPMSRITVIDALRGFALLGVILIHMMQHYGIFSFSGTEQREVVFPALEAAIQWLSQNVIMGKFINIFAFLFGLSFFIQMDRAARKGIDFRKRFIWRMVVLFCIGMVGNCFYTGDVMSIYAVFGLLLVFLFRSKNWVLIALAALLLVGTPRLLKVQYDHLTRIEQVEAADSPRANTTRPSTPSVSEEEPSFINSAKDKLTRGMEGKLNYQFGLFGRGYLTFALFMLGLVVGRLRFFEEVHLKTKRNYLLFAGMVGGMVILNLLIDLIPPQQTGFRAFMMPGAVITPLQLVVTALNDLIAVLFSGAIVMGFVILYQLRTVGRILSVLTPYGRMGLTNYEMQGVIGCMLFSPWALGSIFGNWGATEVFGLGLVIYALQVVVSRYWLTYFLYGPLEWFWRSATYLKVQPFRRIK